MKSTIKKPLRLSQIVETIILVPVAVLLFVYAANGLYRGKIYIPSGKLAYSGAYFYGLSARLIAGAFISLAVYLPYFLMHGLDRRHDKRSYLIFSRWIRIIGVSLAVAAFAIQFWSIWKK